MVNDELSSKQNDDAAATERKPQSSFTRRMQQMNILDGSIRRQARMMAGTGVVNMTTWLATLNKLFDERQYSPSERINFTLPMLNKEQTTWYEENQDEIKDDWKFFCDHLEQTALKQQTTWSNTSLHETPPLNNNTMNTLEEVIDMHFNKYSGEGDAKEWLLQTMNKFKTHGLRREDQFEAIPLLLEGDAYVWYAENSETIFNFEAFSKLFLRRFKLTPPSPTGTADTLTQFFLGEINTEYLTHRLESEEKRANDQLWLYQHSTQCSAALEIFLEENPSYWCFVPTKVAAPTLNRRFLLRNIPKPPSGFVFSAQQRQQQAQFFQSARDRIVPRDLPDLYN
ncbi:unnamed protein product, partial [Adineta ricciae]